MNDADAPDPVARFRALLAAEADLQDILARHERPESFVREALEIAARFGLHLAAGDFGPAASPDPLGVARMSAAPCFIDHWPNAEWLPVDLARLGDGSLALDWAHFAGAPLTEPFFAGSVRRAVARPLNGLLRLWSPLLAPVDAGEAETMRPDGFIFHMSRSGSTLTAAMLATLPDSLVLSEAAPLDTLIRLIIGESWPAKRANAALAALLHAFGRARPPGAPFVVKLHCWHALALDRLRAAFPDVPWIFLYREPAEVIASQLRERGPEFDPAMMHPSWYGIAPDPGLSPEAYCALVLARLCEAADEGLPAGGGLAVSYADLPGAAASTVAGHFRLAVGEAERAAMAVVAGRDAKAPWRPFAAPAPGPAAGAVGEAVERYVRPIFNRLERC